MPSPNPTKATHPTTGKLCLLINVCALFLSMIPCFCPPSCDCVLLFVSLRHDGYLFAILEQTTCETCRGVFWMWAAAVQRDKTGPCCPWRDIWPVGMRRAVEMKCHRHLHQEWRSSTIRFSLPAPSSHVNQTYRLMSTESCVFITAVVANCSFLLCTHLLYNCGAAVCVSSTSFQYVYKE